jgi:hypothetical protein
LGWIGTKSTITEANYWPTLPDINYDVDDDSGTTGVMNGRFEVFHDSNYEECCLLGQYAVWLL